MCKIDNSIWKLLHNEPTQQMQQTSRNLVLQITAQEARPRAIVLITRQSFSMSRFGQVNKTHNNFFFYNMSSLSSKISLMTIKFNKL